jgi:hypothetical protein
VPREAFLTISEFANGVASGVPELETEDIGTAKNPILDERRSRILDAMFGENSPTQLVRSPRELLIDSELIEEKAAANERELPVLRVDISWQTQQQQATDFVRWLTGKPSPSEALVSNISEMQEHLRTAIKKHVRPAVRRELSPRIVAIGKASRDVLRSINKTLPHERTEEQRWRLHRATIELAQMIEDEELLLYLFQREPVRLRCEKTHFKACLAIVEASICGLQSHRALDLGQNGAGFVADLQLIQNLAAEYKTTKPEGWLGKNKMWSAELLRMLILVRAVERRDALTLRFCLNVNAAPQSNYEEHRRRIMEKWSAELLCAFMILEAVGSGEWPIVGSTGVADACEDFLFSAGGSSHDGVDDEVNKFWTPYINAAERAPRRVRDAVLGSTTEGPTVRHLGRPWRYSSSEMDSDWVVKIKKQILECLRFGRTTSIGGIANAFNLRLDFTDRLVRELVKDGLWVPPRQAGPEIM